jgi:TonB family protein
MYMYDKYESISNISAYAVVFIILLLSCFALFSDNTIRISGYGNPISLQYLDDGGSAGVENFQEELELSEKTGDDVLLASEDKKPVVKKPEPVEKKKLPQPVKTPLNAENLTAAGTIAGDDNGEENGYLGGAGENLSDNPEFINHFLRLVQSSLYYPRHAVNAGITGTVEIKVVFSSSGEIKSASIAGKKYNKMLGEAALKTMERVKKEWTPFLRPGREQAVIIPVSFELK